MKIIKNCLFNRVLLITNLLKAQVPPQWDTAKVELTLKLNQVNNGNSEPLGQPTLLYRLCRKFNVCKQQ